MKKVGVLCAIVIIGFFSLSMDLPGAGINYSKYFRTDSAYVFSWNVKDSAWTPSAVMIYNYENGHAKNLLTINYLTRAVQARTDYEYNSKNLLDTETNYYYSGTWVASTRNLYFYDSQGRVSEIDIQKWVNSDWVIDRKQINYQYDDFNRQLVFQAIYWRSNSWTPPETDSSYYDSDGKLIKREAFYATGATDYKIIFTYNTVDLLTEQYAIYPTATGWANWWLANYSYNSCGRKISQVQYSGTATGWVPATKTVFFFHFAAEVYPYRKISVCHKGHTIVISTRALAAHLAHGDCIGDCENEHDSCRRNDAREKEHNPKSPFTISPNPATDRIKIKLTDSDCSVSRIELIDFSGNLVKAVNVKGQEEVEIYRGNLKSGSYLVRLVGDTTYSATVIFK